MDNSLSSNNNTHRQFLQESTSYNKQSKDDNNITFDQTFQTNNINKFNEIDQASEDLSQVPMMTSKQYMPTKFSKDIGNSTQSYKSSKSNSMQLGFKTPKTISQLDFEEQNKQYDNNFISIYEKSEEILSGDQQIDNISNAVSNNENQENLKINLNQYSSEKINNESVSSDDSISQNNSQTYNQLQINEIMQYKRNQKHNNTKSSYGAVRTPTNYNQSLANYDDIDSAFANQINSIPSQLHRNNSPSLYTPNTRERQKQKRINSINRMMESLQKEYDKKENPYQEFTVEDLKQLELEIAKNKQKNEQEIIEFHKKQEKNKKPQVLGQNWKKTKAKIILAQKLCALAQDLKTYGTNPGMTLNNKEIKEFQQIQQIIQQEDKLVKKEKHKVFNLEDPFLNTYYPIFLFFLYLYTCIISPVKIFFNEGNLSVWEYVMEKFVDILFFIDIIIQLNTGYKDNKGGLVTKRRQIFKKYLTSWLIIDILCIFPFEIINLFSPGADDNHIIKFNNYNEIIKLLKMIQFNIRMRKTTGVKDLSNKIKSTDTSLLWFVVNVLLCAHISACFWFFIAKYREFSENTWVYNENLIEQNHKAYLYALYWSIQTITTVGFGDIQPQNTSEQLFCIVWMCFGAGSYSYAVGSLSTMLGQGVSRSQKLQNQTHIMDEFCKYTQIQKDLRYKIKKGLQHANNTIILSSDEKDEFFESIPYPIKWQLSDHMYKAFQYKIPFLRGKDKMFLAQFLIMLEPAQIQAGDNVYKKGEHANLVFFLLNGKVNYIVGNQGLCFKSYVSGSYFGEIEVFRECLRLFTVRCQVNSEFMCIDRDYFLSLLLKYKSIDKEMRKLAKQREQKIQESLTKVAKFQHVYQTSSFWTPKNPHQTYSSIAETIQQNKRKNLILTKQQQLDMQKQISEEYKIQQENQRALKIKKKDQKQSILILLPNEKYQGNDEQNSNSVLNSNSQSDSSSNSSIENDENNQEEDQENQKFKHRKSLFYEQNQIAKQNSIQLQQFDENGLTPTEDQKKSMSQIKEVNELDELSQSFQQFDVQENNIRNKQQSIESQDSLTQKQNQIKSLFTENITPSTPQSSNSLVNPLQNKKILPQSNQNLMLCSKIEEVDEMMEVSRQQFPKQKETHQVIFNIDQNSSDKQKKKKSLKETQEDNIISEQVKQLQKIHEKNNSKLVKKHIKEIRQQQTQQNSYNQSTPTSQLSPGHGFDKRGNVFNENIFQLKLKDENTKQEKKLGVLQRLSLFKPLANEALVQEEIPQQPQSAKMLRQKQFENVQSNLNFRKSQVRKDSKFLRLAALQQQTVNMQQQQQQKKSYLTQLFQQRQEASEVEKWKEKYKSLQKEAGIEIKYLNNKLQKAQETLEIFEKKQEVIMGLFGKLQPEIQTLKQKFDKQNGYVKNLENQVDQLQKQLKKRKQSIQVIGEQNISFGVRIREYDSQNTQNSVELNQNDIQQNGNSQQNLEKQNSNNNNQYKKQKSQFSKNNFNLKNLELNTPQSIQQTLPLTFQHQNDIFNQQLIGTLQTSPTVKTENPSPRINLESFQLNNNLNNNNNNNINNNNIKVINDTSQNNSENGSDNEENQGLDDTEQNSRHQIKSLQDITQKQN